MQLGTQYDEVFDIHVNFFFNFHTGVLLDNITIEPLSPFAVLFFFYPVFPLSLIPLVLLLISQQSKWDQTNKTSNNIETTVINVLIFASSYIKFWMSLFLNFELRMTQVSFGVLPFHWETTGEYISLSCIINLLFTIYQSAWHKVDVSSRFVVVFFTTRYRFSLVAPKNILFSE